MHCALEIGCTGQPRSLPEILTHSRHCNRLCLSLISHFFSPIFFKLPLNSHLRITRSAFCCGSHIYHQLKKIFTFLSVAATAVFSVFLRYGVVRLFVKCLWTSSSWLNLSPTIPILFSSYWHLFIMTYAPPYWLTFFIRALFFSSTEEENKIIFLLTLLLHCLGMLIWWF